MANTTNFNWETPDDTDLVKDGAAAIRTLGNSIDTSFVDLKGGTTGQILSKASNTDLDYTWVANDQGDITEVQAGTGISVASGTGPIPVVTNTVATTFDAKGDLIVGTGADTFAKLTVGTNGHTLVADSAETTGLKWAAAATGGGYTELATSTPSSATTVSFTSISGSYKHLLVTWSELYNDSHGGHGWGVRLNNDSGSNYAMAGVRFNFSSPTKQAQAENYTAADMFYGDYVMAPIGNASNSTWNKTSNGFFIIYDYANTSYKKVVNWGAYNWNNSDSGINAPVMINGIYNSNSAITRLDFIRSSSQTLNGGIIRLYGVS
jgi:hypothetical protein